MEPMLASIMLFGGNFAPRGWAYCDGQILAIASNNALFSLIGTTFGGDGRTSFGLPDLRGRTPIGPRTGPGLSPRSWGQRGGGEYNILTANQLPAHTHLATGKLKVNTGAASSPDPKNNYPAVASGRDMSTSAQVQISDWATTSNDSGGADGVDVTVGNTGGNQAVTNMQPFLAINYIIATVGLYPSRS